VHAKKKNERKIQESGHLKGGHNERSWVLKAKPKNGRIRGPQSESSKTTNNVIEIKKKGKRNTG